MIVERTECRDVVTRKVECLEVFEGRKERGVEGGEVVVG